MKICFNNYTCNSDRIFMFLDEKHKFFLSLFLWNIERIKEKLLLYLLIVLEHNSMNIDKKMSKSNKISNNNFFLRDFKRFFFDIHVGWLTVKSFLKEVHFRDEFNPIA